MATGVRRPRSWAIEQSAATRRHLILAAMQLMAERGLGTVSLRSVNVAAGAKNASAAHYYFGNKLGLIEAIVETLAQDVAAVRAPLIATLRARCTTERVPPREIIFAAFAPFMGLLFHADYGLPGIRFLSRLIVDTSPDVRAVADKFTSPLGREMFDLLNRSLPDLPPRVLQMRILFSLTNLINGMGDIAALATSPFGNVCMPGTLENPNCFIDYITAAISAPPPSNVTEEFIAKVEDIRRAYGGACSDVKSP
jgi:AcrR family transcriptional regulator